MKKALFTGITFLVALAVQAKVQLPNYISSHMVLQQQATLTLRLQARAGSTVSVTPSWNQQTVQGTADANGRCTLQLTTPKAGGPYAVTFDDGERTTITDVLVGEVWLCSGQSNMEMPVSGWGKVMNYEQELVQAHHPDIRLLQVKRITSNTPKDDVELTAAGWQECHTGSVAEFSSIAYFYARELNRALRVPVGVLDCSWGGTPAEAWTELEALSAVAGFEPQVKALREHRHDSNAMEQEYRRQFAAWQATQARPDMEFDKATLQPDWAPMPVPAAWETTVLPNFDGVVWLQYAVELDASFADGARLSLGMIDDDDVTFVNGHEVARGSGWDQPRLYTVGSGVLHAGKNVITVRVQDTAGNGGIHGTPGSVFIESQTGQRISLADNWQYKVDRSYEARPENIHSQNYPTNLYNAMLSPLASLPVKGFLWYQGCANVGRAAQYNPLMKALVTSWRRLWGADLPFYFVQLAGYQAPSDYQPGSEWAALRQAQVTTLELPNTGMAVAIDLGNPIDIHPKN
ncbi:MAG: 9-O-acetylesterase, partial [Bacteroidaceae bacterium]|nr:9-O-acetylesterase [Bacteroidaceae bacterium]